MPPAFLFEIGYKPNLFDPVGQGLMQDITHLGLGKVKNVASAQLYRISGQISPGDQTRIAEDLLADPILNQSRITNAKKAEVPGTSKSMVIDIWYKAGVTDVVGDSVRKGIQDLNITGVQEVRTGMRYHLEGVTRREVAEKIALALLVNPLVHDTVIHAD